MRASNGSRPVVSRSNAARGEECQLVMDSTLAAGTDVCGPDAPVRLGTMSDTAAYDESVLEVALLIPPGRVLTYGDISELLECGGPRQVGAAMSRSGSAVPWWRVIRAGGHPPRGLGREAYPRYAAEGTPLRGTARSPSADDAYAIDLSAARWVPSAEALHAVAQIRQRLGRSREPTQGPPSPEMSVPRDGLKE